ncbi:hypothetical protein [Mesorhizobium sp. M0859]|uniref:hypothetical protein n=1 Tax=Mesorhizobium sp. M0859 TaxID=2957014 RepID=UPI00333508F7
MKYLAMELPSTAEASTSAALATGAGRQLTRRSWTVEQKLAIVREVQESGYPVSVVVRHDMNANHCPRPHRSPSSIWVLSVLAYTM